jgi:predicted Fe-Mo cluster-binding NifX family protein
MKICIPVCGPEGLDAKLNPEFTETEHLFVFDADNGEHRTFSREAEQDGAEEPIAIDVVLCNDMPAGLLRAFAAQGIQVFATSSETAGQALIALQSGEAEELVFEGGCGCQGHGEESHGGCGGGHDDDHECCGGGHQHDDDHECCGGGGGGCGCRG